MFNRSRINYFNRIANKLFRSKSLIYFDLIQHGELYLRMWITEKQWDSIGRLDYAEINSERLLTTESNVHGSQIVETLQKIIFEHTH